MLDIIVSGSYPGLPVWRNVFGKCLNDSFVGLCGMVSAGITIYDLWPTVGPSAEDLASLPLTDSADSTEEEEDNVKTVDPAQKWLSDRRIIG